MKKKSNNKYQVVEDLMKAYCAQCRFKESDQCAIKEKACSKFESKYRELSFEVLHPDHPCRTCIVRPTCDVNGRCEDYNCYKNMRKLADSEVNGEETDAGLSERYIDELKGDPLYAGILETERQHAEYRAEKEKFNNGMRKLE